MKRGLLIIDIQNDYFPNGKMVLDNSEQAAQNASEFMYARLLRMLVQLLHYKLKII